MSNFGYCFCNEGLFFPGFRTHDALSMPSYLIPILCLIPNPYKTPLRFRPFRVYGVRMWCCLWRLSACPAGPGCWPPSGPDRSIAPLRRRPPALLQCGDVRVFGVVREGRLRPAPSCLPAAGQALSAGCPVGRASLCWRAASCGPVRRVPRAVGSAYCAVGHWCVPRRVCPLPPGAYA